MFWFFTNIYKIWIMQLIHKTRFLDFLRLLFCYIYKFHNSYFVFVYNFCILIYLYLYTRTRVGLLYSCTLSINSTRTKSSIRIAWASATPHTYATDPCDRCAHDANWRIASNWFIRTNSNWRVDANRLMA